MFVTLMPCLYVLLCGPKIRNKDSCILYLVSCILSLISYLREGTSLAVNQVNLFIFSISQNVSLIFISQFILS